MTPKERIRQVFEKIRPHFSPGTVVNRLTDAYHKLDKLLPSSIKTPALMEARDNWLNSVEEAVDLLRVSGTAGGWEKAFEGHVQECYNWWGIPDPPVKQVKDRPELDGKRLPIGPTQPTPIDPGASQTGSPGSSGPTDKEVSMEEKFYRMELTDQEYEQWQEDYQRVRNREPVKERLFTAPEHAHLVGWILAHSVLPAARPKQETKKRPNPRKGSTKKA